MTIENVLLVSAALFAIGAYGAVSRSSLITIIMSLELMFNAVVIAVVAFSRFTPAAALLSGDRPVDGRGDSFGADRAGICDFCHFSRGRGSCTGFCACFRYVQGRGVDRNNRCLGTETLIGIIRFKNGIRI